MSDCSKMSERIAKLRELRDSLCNKQAHADKITKSQQIFITQVLDLKKVVDDNNSSVEDIRHKLSELLVNLVESHGIKND